MSDQTLSIFDEEVQDTPQAEEQPTEAPEAQPEAEAKAQSGSEAPQEPIPDTGEKEAAPPVADVKTEQPMAPISAILDEREKRQNAERQLEAMQRQIAQIEAARQQQPAPDWFDDPVKAAQYQQAQVMQHVGNQKLQMSRFFAEREYGSELVQEAYGYFDKNPALTEQFKDEPSPFHAAVEFYKRQKAVEEIGPDPNSWREKERERIREELRQEMQAAQPVQSPVNRPPASLSGAPAGGNPNADMAVNAPPMLNGLFNG